MHSKPPQRAARSAMHAALAGVFCLSAAVTHAQSTAQVPAEQSAGEVQFRVGGIGETEADAMRSISTEYPLALTFVERSSDGRDMFTADVDVSIVDSNGSAQLDTVAGGPILLADLPDGRYTVSATLDGDTKTQQVTVSEGATQRVVFVWPEQQTSQQLSRAD